MEYFGNNPSLSLIEEGINHHAKMFNSLISNPSSQEGEGSFNERLDRINKILQFALGVITGLLEQDKKPSKAYSNGKAVGSITADGMAKLSEGASISGAIVGAVTKHTWLLWTGLAVGFACVALDLTIVGCALYHSKKDEDPSDSGAEQKNIQRVYDQAKATATCVEKFINCQQGSMDPTVYTFEVAKCLKNYRHFPIDQQDSEVYNRMISLFIQHLPQDHPIVTQLKALRKISQELSAPPSDLNAFKNEPPLEMSEEDTLSPRFTEISPQQIYQKRFIKCCELIIKNFNLKPKIPLRFIEITHTHTPFRYTPHGVE